MSDPSCFKEVYFLVGGVQGTPRRWLCGTSQNLDNKEVIKTGTPGPASWKKRDLIWP